MDKFNTTFSECNLPKTFEEQKKKGNLKRKGKIFFFATKGTKFWHSDKFGALDYQRSGRIPLKKEA